MELIRMEAAIDLIEGDFDPNLIIELISILFPTHKYVPFRKGEDLEGLIYVVCSDHSWNFFDVLAIFSKADAIDHVGKKFGSCLIIPSTTLSNFFDTMRRGIKMKAFL